MKQSQPFVRAASVAANGNLSKEWLTNKEAAAYLGVSKMTLQRYRDQGLLEYSKVGSKVYYRLDEIHRLLADNAMISVPD